MVATNGPEHVGGGRGALELDSHVLQLAPGAFLPEKENYAFATHFTFLPYVKGLLPLSVQTEITYFCTHVYATLKD